MQGTIVKVAVEEGQEVAEGDVVVVLEAMKMEQPLKAHKAGTVTGLQAEVGATVTNGAVICELEEFVVDGMPTVIPFHRAVVSDPAFVGAGGTAAGRSRSTRPGSRPTSTTRSSRTPASRAEAEEAGERQRVVVEVGGKRLEVVLPGRARRAGRRRQPARRREEARAQGRARRPARPPAATPSPARCRARSSRSPSRRARTVAEGDVVVVLEAMKMEQPLKAHKAGTVTGLQAEVGATVTNGAVICELKD